MTDAANDGLSILVFALLVCEIFALIHHAALSVRRRLTRESGVAISVTQADLVRLQGVALLVAILPAALRLAAGRTPGPALLAWPAFVAAFVLGVYWRYPAAAPLDLPQPDWTVGGGRFIRWFLVGYAALGLAVCVGMLLVLP